MSHKSLRTLIEKTVHAIHDDAFFYYGEESDFSVAKKKNWLMCNLAPLTATASFADNNVLNYSKSWNCAIVFYRFDKQSDVKYGEILDETDVLVDNFINKLNQQQGLVISSMNQQPFIKAVDTMTGHLLTFTATVTDDFEYCEDC